MLHFLLLLHYLFHLNYSYKKINLLGDCVEGSFASFSLLVLQHLAFSNSYTIWLLVTIFIILACSYSFATFSC